MFGIPFPSFLQIITNSHMPDIKDPGGMKVIYSCCPISWRKKTSAPPRWRVWKVQEDEVTMTPWHVTMTWMIWGTPPFHVKMPLTNSPIHPGMWVRIWALLLILLELDVQNIPKRKVSELIAKCCNIHCYFIYIYMYIYMDQYCPSIEQPKKLPHWRSPVLQIRALHVDLILGTVTVQEYQGGGRLQKTTIQYPLGKLTQLWKIPIFNG